MLTFQTMALKIEHKALTIKSNHTTHALNVVSLVALHASSYVLTTLCLNLG